MKLAVSNIAWSSDEEPAAADLLNKLGVKYIETAPTKKWDDPFQAKPGEVSEYVDFWKANNLELVALQSMLFNRPDLKIFESQENRQETLAYLKNFISLAGRMGAGVMVFGSPKNRQKDPLSYGEAFEVATGFFKELGDEAQKHDVKFCIEPNPEQYNCDFVTNTKQGIEIVTAVGSPGFGLHLDIAGMTLAGDNIAESIQLAALMLRHFHISAPYLEQVENRHDVDYKQAVQTLKKINYQGFVSIEMKPGANGQNLDRVKKAVEFAQSLVG